MLYTILKHTHSGIRWIVIFLLLAVVVSGLFKLFGKKQYKEGDRKLGLFTMAFTHTQFIIGLVLYFISSKVVFSAESMSNDLLRFFLVEHFAMMLIAIILLTVGYVKTKKAQGNRKKLSRQFWYYFIALIIILLAIPWPWQNYAAGWF